MGVMRFQVSSLPTLEKHWPDLYRAYMTGADGRVYPTRVEVDGTIITCRRNVSDSGRLHVAWPIAGFGTPVVCTASLVERAEPYLLSLELARGKIALLRDQISAWEISGMSIPATFEEPFQEAHRLFRKAAAIQDRAAEANALGAESLRWALVAGDIAVKSYASQRMAARRKRSPLPPVALGCSLSGQTLDARFEKLFLETFTAAAVPVQWRNVEPETGHRQWETSDQQVEWCLANRLLVCGGPLLNFGPEAMPAWLGSWSKDTSNLQSLVCDYVETAVARYAGQIRKWEVCANANTGGALGLSEEDRLVLVARALDVVRQVDDEIQVLVQIDQPWGDYQSRGTHRLSPLQFVDALLRSGIGLSAVNLEVAVGFRPRGSSPRDLVDLSRMLDNWGALGIPLYVTLACPSDNQSPDPLANAGIQAESDDAHEAWNETAQSTWIDSVLPVFMAKQAVVGIFLTHFSDGAPHDYPHAGLLRPDGTPKPAFERIKAQRRAFYKTENESSQEEG
jgi:Glycosyl hydrolase family 10